MSTAPHPLRVAAMALLLSCCAYAVGTAAVSREYAIKAQFLHRFALFVEWPADAFPTAETPLAIGVIGHDPFGPTLDETVRDKRINNRRIVVRRLQWNQDLRGLHIAFLSTGEASRIGELTGRLQGLPVLIVGDSEDLARRGATMNFRIDDNRVQFDINREAATRARLKVSASMLDLARIVRDARTVGAR